MTLRIPLRNSGVGIPGMFHEEGVKSPQGLDRDRVGATFHLAALDQ